MTKCKWYQFKPTYQYKIVQLKGGYYRTKQRQIWCFGIFKNSWASSSLSSSDRKYQEDYIDSRLRDHQNHNDRVRIIKGT